MIFALAPSASLGAAPKKLQLLAAPLTYAACTAPLRCMRLAELSALSRTPGAAAFGAKTGYLCTKAGYRDSHWITGIVGRYDVREGAASMGRSIGPWRLNTTGPQQIAHLWWYPGFLSQFTSRPRLLQSKHNEIIMHKAVVIVEKCSTCLKVYL